ncbi:MAG: DNA processing protein DprA [Candidatus Parcubacteria bacterium]|nr:MAG: DNA processing protein DprA [Candidatus Parcubacteria bacterium]
MENLNLEDLYFNFINKNFKPYQPRIFKLYHKLESFKDLYFKLLEDKNNIGGINLDLERRELENLKVKILKFKDAEYPNSLKNIDNPPLGLYLLGNIDLIKNPNLSLAIVGTRKPSNYGTLITNKFASQLSELGITIISGLAYGIDTFAHKSTFNNEGKTIAVLGEGIGIALKSDKGNLIKKILENNGLIISEFSPFTTALPYHFPLRNRIIAALSDGVLIIEAPINSGSLITANYSLKFGKEIFVIPGEITNKNFEGSHNLIKQGAKLVTSIDDILSEFNFNYDLKNKLINIKLSPQEELIYECLKLGAKSIEEINKETKLSISDLLVILTHMEIKKIIKNKEGKFYLIN